MFCHFTIPTKGNVVDGGGANCGETPVEDISQEERLVWAWISLFRRDSTVKLHFSSKSYYSELFTVMPHSLLLQCLIATIATPHSNSYDMADDLEHAQPVTAEGTAQPAQNTPEDSRLGSHTMQELMERAQLVNATGKFIFSSYSELNVFLILRAQDQILELQKKLQDHMNGRGTWSDADDANLQYKL